MSLYLIIGASNDTEKYGSKVFLDLLNKEQNVVAINKHGGEVHNTPAYASLTEFLDRVEQLFSKEKRKETVNKAVIVFVVPPEQSLLVLKEAYSLGFHEVWFQPGSESEGAIDFCKEHGIKETHDACIMT